MKSPCTELIGVGKKVAEKLALLNIYTMQDLLFHLPFRYEDRTTIISIKDTQDNDNVLIEGVITSGRVQYGRRRSFVCNIDDGTGIVSVRLFYFGASQVKQLSTPNTRVRCFGSVRVNGQNRELVHPEYQVINELNLAPLEKVLTPVYPTTAGVNQALLRKTILQVTNQFLNTSLELLPEKILKQLCLINIADALETLHFPVVADDVYMSIKRLAFEELLAHHLMMKQARMSVKKYNAYSVDASTKLIPKLMKQLPFDLTCAQERVFDEIKYDLTSSCPMTRLIQGDVGSGKTIVALMSALCVVEKNMQVAFMAPTEILANQHYHNFKEWCDSLDVSVAVLLGSMKVKEKRQQLANIASGEAKIIVGTHALFQSGVEYQKLALVIIDEQHRFGVHQRLALYNKGESDSHVPHQLVMTATPIPRSLAMTAYADLDCSIIGELPPGRTPVLTVSIDNQRRDEILDRIKAVKKRKQQVYWVCTLIDESENIQCQAAEKTAEYLTQLLPDFEVGLVHGRMKPQKKNEIMTAFKDAQFDILVATTVIEVGVDIPNATLMVIENAERLGLSQLHQLRGRVGRGAKKSYCVLMYQNPLTEHARERIKLMRKTNDGFEIAKHDLLMRGPGELLGTKQTGAINYKIADLIRDQSMLPKVHQAANFILSHWPEIQKQIIERWEISVTEYAKV